MFGLLEEYDYKGPEKPYKQWLMIAAALVPVAFVVWFLGWKRKKGPKEGRDGQVSRSSRDRLHARDCTEYEG
jgi:hypothetical protein